MAVVKVKLKTEYCRKDGTYQVVIYAYDVKPQYIDTGVAVKAEQFQDVQDFWICKHPDAKLLNQQIEEARIRVRDGMVPGAGYVPGVKIQVGKVAFTDYIRTRANQFKQAQRIDMYHKCCRMADELEELAGRKVYSHEITHGWIRSYYAACRAIPNTNNTAQRKVKNLRTLFNQGVVDGLFAGPNPFDSWKVSLEPVNKEKLTMEQIRQIEQLQLDPRRAIFHARNAFLISFFCQGMRFENVCQMKWENIQDGHYKYQMNKGKKWRRIEIHERLAAVLKHYEGNRPYILPFFKTEIRDAVDLRNRKGAANTQVNEHLKVVAQLADIDIPLSFHMARHSFASAAKEGGVSEETIKDSLGHTDVKVTQAYLKSFEDKRINDAVSVVWK